MVIIVLSCPLLADISVDWSDHGLWWTDKNMWLTRTRSTLDQYGVQSDALLWFTPMHKNLRVQLADLQVLDMRVDFSVNVFNVVIKICKELGELKKRGAGSDNGGRCMLLEWDACFSNRKKPHIYPIIYCDFYPSSFTILFML